MKIVLVDDHKIVREGITALLKNENGFEIVGEASSGKELIESIESLQSDVIVMDANMPEMDGLETLQHLKERNKDVKVLILSMADDEKYIKKFMDEGAKGYILKNSGKEELVNALKSIHAGNIYLSADITMKLLAKVSNNGFSETWVKEKTEAEISKRELEVLQLISDGYTNGQIADKLFTSKRTIESHRRNLIEKTKTKNTAELIKYALSKGILKFESAH
jgi:DNA-binding NarL/FixJ family response regulator